jgi:tetratricopeptide (TPR) repeat protein
LAQAWLNLGVVLHAELDFEGALTALTRAWALWPNSPQVASNLSAALLGLKRADEALQLARFAVSAAPESDEAGLNLGCALRDLGQIAAAEAEYERVVAMATRLAPRAALNLAALCGERQRGADAVRWLEFMLRLEPNAADGALALGVEYLAQGEMLAGWPLYEHRLNAASGQKLLDVPASLPLWSGESLAGKRVLVVPEQGFGDELQFCRFVPRLRALGASTVGLVARQALLRLLPSLAGIDALIPLADLQQAGDWDYWVPMMSLPLRLGVDLAQVGSPPYLSPPSDAAARWRSALQRPSIGLVWRGNPNHANDRHRSLPDLNTLAPLAALAGVQWVNLQINATPSELEAAAQPGLPLMDPSAALNDFADTAALVSALDLVITVDTAVAHLAGALGRPCWVLLPWIGCDWRWLRDRADSPWYDSARLYRQPHEGDWASVIEAVTRDLQRQLLQTPDALG